TQGMLPFDGFAGANYGNWRTYPVRQLKIDCIGGCSDADLRHKLELIEEDYRKSGFYVSRGDASATPGGGSSNSRLVQDFVENVYKLSKSPIHLYSCAEVGPKTFYWWPQ